MASVYYLLDDAVHVETEILKHYTQESSAIKQNYQAAVTIQRYYRGYNARKYVKFLHKSATLIQKYVRGWLVRYKMPDLWHQEYDRVCLLFYNKMATKIQALWKGIMTRRKIPVKEILEEKRKQEEEAQKLRHSSSKASKSKGSKNKQKHKKSKRKSGNIDSSSEESNDEERKSPYDQFYVEKIFKMLFDRHHLLSTFSMKGILGDVKQNQSELSEIEKILSSVPWKGYMKQFKKIYQDTTNHLNKCNKPPQYMFNNQKLRRQEDVLRLKFNDGKEVDTFGGNGDSYKTPKKSFVLNSKLTKPPYERLLLNHDKFKVPETRIVRTEDPSKNISETDFKLVFRELIKNCNVPDYYADFWYHSCSVHNLK